MMLARRLADLTSKSRVYAFVYLGLAFYLIPFALIYLWR
jgi:hypothetical protein